MHSADLSYQLELLLLLIGLPLLCAYVVSVAGALWLAFSEPRDQESVRDKIREKFPASLGKYTLFRHRAK